MAIVVFQDDNIKINVKKGKTVRQIASSCGASLNFGCRVGDCGACESTVTQGSGYLSVRSPKEEKYFSLLGIDDQSKRLMCQCSIESEDGEITIEYGV